MGYVIKLINVDNPKDVWTGQVFATWAEAQWVMRNYPELMRYVQTVLSSKIVDGRYIRLIAEAA